jgi:hypothetical protein
VDVKAIFMIGPPRTGTTLLSRLLATGDNVLSLSEPFHLHAILNRWVLAGYYRWFQHRCQLRRMPVPNRCTAARYLDFLREMAAANGLRYLVVKEVFHELGLPPPFRNLDLLSNVAAHSDRVLGIVRHPCDAAASTVSLLHWLLGKHRGCIIRLLWPSVPRFRDDNHIIRWAAQNWAHFVDWSQERALCVIRYEDLVADPAEALPRICNHIGLPFHERMLDHHHHDPAAFGGGGDPKVMLCRPRPVHCESVGRGRDLTRGQYESVRNACARQAAELGYRL